MKKKFLKTIAAVAMIFSFAGFVRAQDELKITASLENAGEGVQLSNIEGNACSASDVVLSTGSDTKTTLTLTCAGADEIYYTTDGNTEPAKPQDQVPEVSTQSEGLSTKYTAPIELTAEMFTGDDTKTLVIKAKAFKAAAVENEAQATAEEETSEVLTITLTLKAQATVPEKTATPTFKVGEEAKTAYELSAEESAKVTVTIVAAEGASVYYTTDGETPTVSGTAATSRDVEISGACTLKVIAKEADKDASDVAEFVVTKAQAAAPEKPAVPTFATRNGAEADTIVVLLGEADSIFVAQAKDTVSAYAASFAKYTEDAKIVADQDTLVFIAYAVKGTDKVHSDTVAYRYIKPTVTPDPEEPETVAVPSFETKAGAEADTIVVLLGEADSIFVAKAKDTVSAYAASFVKYTEDAKIIADQDTLVFIAYAVKEEVHSDTVAYRYIKPTVTPDPEEPEKVAAPIIDTIKGQDKADSVVIVKFDATKADSIFVATGKNLASATAFAKFTKNDTIVLSQDTAVRAYAMKDGKYSDTVRYIYTATVTPEPEKDTVATPVFSLKGEVNKGDTLYITCATEGAEIFYALDTVKFVKYENGIEITEDVTVKAFAKKGEIVSDTVEVSLTVKTQANEGKELSGVSIYPNPSNGEFKVAVPVNATVEMFNTNGQMVKRANLVAGVNTLRMNNSGIYFVRFTAANGQVVIKKVIVR